MEERNYRLELLDKERECKDLRIELEEYKKFRREIDREDFIREKKHQKFMPSLQIAFFLCFAYLFAEGFLRRKGYFVSFLENVETFIHFVGMFCIFYIATYQFLTRNIGKKKKKPSSIE